MLRTSSGSSNLLSHRLVLSASVTVTTHSCIINGLVLQQLVPTAGLHSVGVDPTQARD